MNNYIGRDILYIILSFYDYNNLENISKSIKHSVICRIYYYRKHNFISEFLTNRKYELFKILNNKSNIKINCISISDINNLLYIGYNNEIIKIINLTNNVNNTLNNNINIIKNIKDSKNNNIKQVKGISILEENNNNICLYAIASDLNLICYVDKLLNNTLFNININALNKQKLTGKC